MPVNVPQVLRL